MTDTTDARQVAAKHPTRLPATGREMVVEALEAIDAWCKARAASITADFERHVMAGGSVEGPAWKVRLGEHQAYSAMRSYLHGSRATLARLKEMDGG